MHSWTGRRRTAPYSIYISRGRRRRQHHTAAAQASGGPGQTGGRGSTEGRTGRPLTGSTWETPYGERRGLEARGTAAGGALTCGARREEPGGSRGRGRWVRGPPGPSPVRPEVTRHTRVLAAAGFPSRCRARDRDRTVELTAGKVPGRSTHPDKQRWKAEAC